MATRAVAAVRTRLCSAHAHVEALVVAGTPPREIDCGALLRELLDPDGDRYVVRSSGRELPVVLASCPVCGAGGCLTTDPAQAPGNALFALPGRLVGPEPPRAPAGGALI